MAAGSAITDNGALVFNRGNTVTQGTDFSGGAINGTGSLVQAGSGTLVLNASNSYSGGTTLNAGALVLANTSGSALGSGNLMINGGTLASGAVGSMTGNVTASSGINIAPGGSGQFGQLTVGGLTTSNQTTLDFDLSSPVSNGTYGGDLITVSSAGPLSIGASTTIALSSLPTAIGDYRLLADSNSSALAIAGSNFVLPTLVFEFVHLRFEHDRGYGLSGPGRWRDLLRLRHLDFQRRQ